MKQEMMFHVPQNFNDGIMLCRGRKNSKRVIFNGVIHIENDSVLVNRIVVYNSTKCMKIL